MHVSLELKVKWLNIKVIERSDLISTVVLLKSYMAVLVVQSILYV